MSSFENKINSMRTGIALYYNNINNKNTGLEAWNKGEITYNEIEDVVTTTPSLYENDLNGVDALNSISKTVPDELPNMNELEKRLNIYDTKKNAYDQAKHEYNRIEARLHSRNPEYHFNMMMIWIIIFIIMVFVTLIYVTETEPNGWVQLVVYLSSAIVFYYVGKNIYHYFT
jgi:hypothetical protein